MLRRYGSAALIAPKKTKFQISGIK